MVHLIPMTEGEFQLYLQTAVREYAEEHVKAGNWHPDDALEKSEKEFQSYLPDGLATLNQYLYTIEDESPAKVGLIWLAAMNQGAQRFAFIYDFVIYASFRRKGYGQQALLAAEEKVKALGLDTISLHVFGHNRAAIALYEKAGYEITNLQMSKKLNATGHIQNP